MPEGPAFLLKKECRPQKSSIQQQAASSELGRPRPREKS